MGTQIRTWEGNVQVQYSEIHGNGIFASMDIPADELVMLISGEVINTEECIRREEQDNNVYIFWNGDNYIDTSTTEKIKYINHDCEPNCYVDDFNEHTLALYSMKEIKSGEELTIDYGYEEIYDACNCKVCTQDQN